MSQILNNFGNLNWSFGTNGHTNSKIIAPATMRGNSRKRNTRVNLISRHNIIMILSFYPLRSRASNWLRLQMKFLRCLSTCITHRDQLSLVYKPLSNRYIQRIQPRSWRSGFAGRWYEPQDWFDAHWLCFRCCTWGRFQLGVQPVVAARRLVLIGFR